MASLGKQPPFGPGVLASVAGTVIMDGIESGRIKREQQDLRRRTGIRQRQVLLERDRRALARGDELRRARASLRARAAARGVAGGASTRAAERGLARRAGQDQSFDDAAANLQLAGSHEDLRHDLFEVTKSRRRASLGMLSQHLPIIT